MQNVERSMTTIDLFRRLGVSVAIDDFGTGHSSLSYLKNLVVDVIKIDRSFISGLPGDDRDNAIVEMMLRITDRFGFASLAEGIETEAQLSWLREHGCRYGQGYLVAKPEAFEVLLDRLQMTSSARRVTHFVSPVGVRGLEPAACSAAGASGNEWLPFGGRRLAKGTRPPGS
jgi:EAL domain-containing protein (putative c-di-GMP-specific phosphodiesterase class I)